MDLAEEMPQPVQTYRTDSDTEYAEAFLGPRRIVCSKKAGKYIMTIDGEYLIVGFRQEVIDTLRKLKSGQPVQPNYMAQLFINLKS